jgi:hypothetical protein
MNSATRAENTNVLRGSAALGLTDSFHDVDVTALQRTDAKLSCGGFSQVFGHIGS